jgi:hypothetical protein
MRDTLPFPNGHNPLIEQDLVVEAKGLVDASLKGRKIRIKGLTETDILDIRKMLLEEIKRQNEEEELQKEYN